MKRFFCVMSVVLIYLCAGCESRESRIERNLDKAADRIRAENQKKIEKLEADKRQDELANQKR